MHRGHIQFIRFLRLGCTPAKASSSPAPAPAPAPDSTVSPCPAPPVLAFLSFSLCICFVVRCRSSLSLTFLALILDWRYSDFPPPPALFHISLRTKQFATPKCCPKDKDEIRFEGQKGCECSTYVNSTLILLGGYFPSSKVEW